MISLVLTNRNFRNYLLSDIISMFGTGMTFIGMNWYVLELTGLNKYVGYVLSIHILAGLVAFPFVGTICDRYNRKWIVFWSNLARAVVAVGVIVLLRSGASQLALLYVISVVSGIGWSILLPASRALIQEIMDKGKLVEANSFLEISYQAGLFVASGCAGLIYKYCGFEVILVIDAATFILGNYFLLKMKYAAVEIKDRHEGFRVQFCNGIKFLRNNGSIFMFGIVIYIPLIATIASNTVLPGYIRDYLSGDSIAFGISDMIYGIGAFSSGFIVTLIVAYLSRLKIIAVFFIISCSSLLYLCINRHVFGLYAAYLLFGLSNSSLRIIFQTIMMEIVPKSHFGRAMAVWQAISSAMQITFIYILGHMIDTVPIEQGYLLLSIVMAVGFIGTLGILPRVNKISK